MATEINIPVKLQIQNLQSLVGDLEKRLSNLKVGSTGFKTIQSLINSIRGEIDKLQVQTSKPFMDAGQFTKAEHSVERLEDQIDKVSLSLSRIKFSDLELTSEQKADLKTFEDQINSIKEKLRVVKSTAKEEFLNSALGQEWLKIDETAFSKSLSSITNDIRREAQAQKDELDKLRGVAADYQKALSENQRIKDFTSAMVDDPKNGTDIFSKKWQELTKELSNGKVQFQTGGKNLMVSWLESQLKLDSGTLNALLSKSVSASNISQELKRILNEQLAKNEQIIQNNPNIEANVDTLRTKYDGLLNILRQVGASEEQVAAVEANLRRELGETANKTQEYQQKLVAAAQAEMQMNSTSNAMKSQLESLRNTLQQTNTQFIQMQRTQQSFNQMKMAIVNFMGFSQVLNLTKTAIRNAINHIKELDSVMNKISIVTDMSTGDLWNQVDAYSKMAQTFGVSIKGAYEVSQIYYQQGLQTNDVLTLTNETLKLAKISGLDYATTTDFMTTAIRGFKMEMSDASRVVDVYSNLASHTAVSQEELAVAMSKTASSMEAVGATFEESSAMIGTMVAVTRESATNIGSAMKSIASRYGELTKDPTKLVDEDGEAMAFNKVDAALQSVGISMKTVDGQFRNFTDVIIELGEKWSELDSTQQRYIATQFAGNRQQSRFLALVSNVDMLKSNLDVAMNSEDTGTLQALKALDSIEAKTEQVRVAYQQFYTTIGAEDIWKGFLDGAKNVINTLNSLPKLFGKIPIGAIASITSIITLIKSLGMDLLNTFAQTFGQSMVQGALQAQGQATEGARSLIGIVLSTIKGKKGEFVAAGQESVQAYSQGMQQESTTLTPDKLTGQNKVLYNQKTATISALTKYDALHTTDGVAVGMAREALEAGLITQTQHDSLAGTTDGAAARVAAFVEQLKREVAALSETSEAAEQSSGKLKNFINNHKNLSQGLQSFGSALNMVAMTINTTAEGGKTWSGVLQGMAAAATLASVAVKVLDTGLKSMPWMALASGVLMAINAISTLIVTPEERLEELNKKAEELSNKAKEEKANYRTLDNSIKKLDELAEKRYESAEAAEEYQTAVDDLTSKFPILIAGFDETGNAILNTKDMETVLADARKASAEATLAAVNAEKEKTEQELKMSTINLIDKLKDITFDPDKIEEEKSSQAKQSASESLYDESIFSESGLKRMLNLTGSGDVITEFEALSNIDSASSVFSTMMSRLSINGISFANGGELDQGLTDLLLGDEFKQSFDEDNQTFDLMKLQALLSEKKDRLLESGEELTNAEKGMLNYLNTLFDTGEQIISNTSESVIVTDNEKNSRDKLSSKLQEYLTVNQDTLTSDVEVLNDLLTNIQSSAGKGDTESVRKYYNWLKEFINNLPKGSQILSVYKNELESIDKEVGPLVSTYVTSANADIAATRKQISTNLTSKGYLSAEASKESNLVALTTEYLADNYVEGTDLTDFFNGDIAQNAIEAVNTFWKQLAYQYDNDGNTLQTRLISMLNDTSHYSADDIIKELNIDDDSLIAQILKSNWENTYKDIKNSITSNISTKVNSRSKDNTFTILNTIFEYVTESEKALTSIDASYYSIITSQIDKLERSGYIDRASTLGEASITLKTLLNDVDESTRNAILDSIKTNGIATREGIAKVISDAKAANASKPILKTLDELYSGTVTNILLSIRALTDDFTSNWTDSSKNLSKLTSGIDFTEVQTLIDEVKSFGEITLDSGEIFTLDRSDFRSNGDKLVLTAEKASDYWEALSKYNINQAKSYQTELDTASELLKITKDDTGKYKLGVSILDLFETDNGYNAISTILGDELTNYLIKDEEGNVKLDTNGKSKIDTSKLIQLRNRIIEKFGEDNEAIQEYLQYLSDANEQIEKARQWDKGDYSSLVSIYEEKLKELSESTGKQYINYMQRINDLAAGARYTDWELEYPDIQLAVENYTSGYSALLQDIIDKGANKINVNAYKGIDRSAVIKEIVASHGDTTKLILAFAEKAGYDLEATNDALLTAINKKESRIRKSQDTVKDLQFLNETTFAASLDSLKNLANEFQINFSDLFKIATYDEQLQKYVVDMRQAEQLGIDWSKIENIQKIISESVNAMLDNVIKSLTSAFGGSLAGKDLKQLKLDLKSFGIELDESQFHETAEGFKISNTYATSLYYTIQKINSLQGQVLFSELAKNLQETDEHYTSIAANTARITELQNKINKINNYQRQAENVNLIDHANHVISPESMISAGWTDFDGDYATLYSQTYTGADWEDINANMVVNVTPITNDGTTILSPDDLNAYIADLMSNSSNAEEIKLNDTKNLIMGAWDVDVSDAKALADGIAVAEKEAERLHEESEALGEALDELDNPNSARITQYEEELALAKEIKEVRSTTEDSSFNFMDNELPSSFSNPANFYSSMFEARDTLSKALSDTSTGINYDDFYNMVTTFNSIAGTAGTEIEIAGMTFDGKASTAASYIEQGFSALKDINNDGSLQVSLGDLGFDLTSSADSLDASIDTMIDTIAKDQIDMLDSMISLLEVIVAMEKLGDIDVNADNKLNLDEVFDVTWSDDNKTKIESINGFTETWTKTINELITWAETEEGQEFKTKAEEMKITWANGNTTMWDLLKTSEGDISDWTDEMKTEYATLVSAFYEAAMSGDYNLDNIIQSVKDVLAGTGFEGEISLGGQTYVFSRGKSIVKLENGKYTGANTKKEYNTAAEAAQAEALVEAGVDENNLIATKDEKAGTITYSGKMKIDTTEFEVELDENNNPIYTSNGQPFTSKFDAIQQAYQNYVSAAEEAGETIETYAEWSVRVNGKFIGGEVSITNETEFQSRTHEQVQALADALANNNVDDVVTTANAMGITVKTTVNAEGQAVLDEETRQSLTQLVGIEDKTIAISVNGGQAKTDADALLTVLTDIDNANPSIDITTNSTVETAKAVLEGINDTLTSIAEKKEQAIGITTNDIPDLSNLSVHISEYINDGDPNSLVKALSAYITSYDDSDAKTKQLKIETLTAYINEYNDQNAKVPTLEELTQFISDIDTVGADTALEAWRAAQEAKTISITPEIVSMNTEGSTVSFEYAEPEVKYTSTGEQFDPFANMNNEADVVINYNGDATKALEVKEDVKKEVESDNATLTIDADDQATEVGEEARDTIDAMMASITLTAEGDALSTIQSIASTLSSINGQTYTTTLNTTVNTSSSGGGNVNPAVNMVNATGNLGLAKAQGTLMGELGPELVVSHGRYFVAGQNGAEFVDLADDAIVFNHLQTQQLLKNGISSTRGQAVTSERNAVSFAKGSITGGLAMASASAALAALKQLRSMWESLLDSSVSDLAGTGGSGGGGGNDDSATARSSYLADVERWYNWLQKIAVLEEKINTEEAKRSKYQASMVAQGAEYAKSNLQTLKDLESEAITYQALANTQQEFFNLRRSQLNNGAFSRFYTFDENGQLKYNDSDLGYKFLAELMARDDYGEAKYSAEQQYNMLVGAGMESYMKYDSSGTEILMDEDSEDQSSFYSSSVQAFWDLVDSQKEEMQSLHDSIVEYGDSVIEKQTAAYEIMKEIEDNQIAVEDRVLAAIEDTRQREIDELQDQRDAIEDAANSLIDGLSNQLQKEQDMYANQDSADELSKLQRQLGILQRSGGSASQIASLQKEITQKQREAYFDAQQEQIDALKEASDNEIERLDRQIELMTESLEYEKENGLLWNAVYEVMAGTPEEITDFITKHDSQYWGESPTKLTQDTRDILFDAGQFVTYRENVTNGIDELVSHFTDEAIQQGATEEAANSSGGGGSTGNGGGSSSGGSDEDDSSGSNSGSSASGITSSSASNNSISNAVQAVKNTASAIGLAVSKAFTPKTNEWASPDNKVKSQTTKSQEEAYEWLSSGKRIISKFDEGGMIDEDQFAFVHAKESVLTPEQTSILRNDILSSKSTSLLSLLTDFRDAYTNISGESAYSTVNNSNGVTIEQAVVEMHVSKIANDYDAQRAGEQALEKMVQIARKTQGQNRVGR